MSDSDSNVLLGKFIGDIFANHLFSVLAGKPYIPLQNENDLLPAVRESKGTYAISGPASGGGGGNVENSFNKWDHFKQDDDESRFTSLSPTGTLLAVGNSSLVHVYSTVDGNVKFILRHRLLNARFSPLDGYLVCWDNPSKSKQLNIANSTYLKCTCTYLHTCTYAFCLCLS